MGSFLGWVVAILVAVLCSMLGDALVSFAAPGPEISVMRDVIRVVQGAWVFILFTTAKDAVDRMIAQSRSSGW